MNCHYCKSENCIKFGTTQNKQRYRCKDCGKTFILDKVSTQIILTAKERKKLINQLLKNNKITIANIEDNCNLSKHRLTLYFWRHKIFSEIAKFQDEIVLEGQIQIDETYFSVSYKGNYKNSEFKLPRPARKRSNDLDIRGLSGEKIAVLTAIDETGKSLAIPICTGRPSSQIIYNSLKNHLKKGSVLITDSASCYNKIAKKLNLKLIKIPSNKHSTEIEGIVYHINTINNYHKRLKNYMSSFNGVSSKFLYEYTNWFAFIDRKDLTEKQKKTNINQDYHQREFSSS